MSKNTQGPKRKSHLAGGAVGFASCYLLVLVFVFIMIVLNNPKGWKSYFHEETFNIIFLIVSIFFLVFIVYFYFFFEDKQYLTKPGNVLLLFTLLIISMMLCYAGSKIEPHVRPILLFPLITVFLTNRRHALFLNFIFTFLMFDIDYYTNLYPEASLSAGLLAVIYAPLVHGFVSGTLAVYLSGRVKTRAGLLLTGLVLAVPTMIICALLNLSAISGGVAEYAKAVGFRGIGCIVSAILALALLPLFEGMFNRLTAFRLRELTSTNAPLINRLKQEAPGTFNHSLIVAQLCESCAVAVGENAELARAAAYYHDVGKLKQPDCFTENQTDYNVHNELTPELSADIIRSHAKDGYELLVSAHLPKQIADIAREHHGTLPIKYFYDKAMRLSGGEANLKDFSYFGPTPQSKLAAIVMIADGAEAATRALADRTPENVERTVRSIIEERIDLDQFAECDITMKELTIIKQTLVSALSGIHHHRVEYPAIRFTRDKQTVKEEDETHD